MGKCPKCGYKPKTKINELARKVLLQLDCNKLFCEGIRCDECPLSMAQDLLREMRDA